MDECQGGHMSRRTSGFVDLCHVDERRTAECRVDECLGTLGTELWSGQLGSQVPTVLWPNI